MITCTHIIYKYEDILINALLLSSIDYRENTEFSRQIKHSPLTLFSSLPNGVIYSLPNVVISSELDDAIEAKFLNKLKQYIQLVYETRFVKVVIKSK